MTKKTSKWNLEKPIYKHTIERIGINKALRYLCNPYVVTIALIALGAALRVWPLNDPELRVPWLTFYPTVMVAALFGGFFAGLLGVCLSCLIILFLWPVFSAQPFIQGYAGWLSTGVFLFNCTLISWVAEAMRRAQKRAKEAKEQAEAANRAKSVFLSNMSHELRTPLNAILGFTGIMRNSPGTTKEQIKSLDIVSRSGEHLLGLINNILDISKIESGRIVLEESDVDLHRIIQEVISLLSVRAKEKGLHLNMEQSEDFPRFVTIDAGKLRQVLINIIGNAIKFTESGGVILRASIAKKKTPHRIRVRFEIEDTGTGIRAEDKERVFRPFRQLGERPTIEPGTGLGLTISKQDVELMGGQIGFTSEYGKGSLFYFEIPVILAVAPPTEEELRSNLPEALAEGQPRYRLLIVEDQPENCLLLHKLLEPFGFELREAEDGQEAVTLFEQWHPHLIWMDIRMPVMDGLEATRRIKSNASGIDTKIVALTAHALEEERLEILAAGCDHFIRKPYSDAEIFDTLVKQLGVKFLYGDEKVEIPHKTNELEIAEMENIPAVLIQELRRSAELLNARLCLGTIDKIRDISPNVGETLRRMVEDLQYQELLVLLDNLVKKEDT